MITNKLNSRVFQVLLNLTLALTLLIGSAAFPARAHAASTITVATNADEINSNGLCSLREAITNANGDNQTYTDCVIGSGNDTIQFNDALGTTTILLGSTLPDIVDPDGLTINGGGDVTISGGNLHRIFVAYFSSLTLNNLTLANGKVVSAIGGAISANQVSLIINDSTFSGNSATNGGGIYIIDGTLAITNSSFSGNSATYGGGVNSSGSGGTLTITNSIFSANVASGGGGGSGVYAEGTMTLTKSTFTDNTGGRGSIYNGGASTIANSTFSGNSSSGINSAGGIYNQATLTISNSAFSGNSTVSGGGDIYQLGASSTLNLYNNILANNGGGGNCVIGDGTVSGNNNLIEDATTACGFTNTVNGNIIGSDPNLGVLTGSPAYFPLNSGSLAINAGDDTICATAAVNNTSQNGVTRPQGAHCDIGSYEFDSGGDTTGVFRPGNGLLYLKNTNTSGFADVAINYGTAGDYPVVGDWDGNGTATIGIYRNGIFYLRNSNTLGFADLVFAFGTPGDQPIAGDWDNNGTDTIGVYRGSTVTFELRNSNTAGAPDVSFQLGLPGDIGIAGDWNGDGMDTTGVFRPSNGVIFMKNANTSGFADIAINYGIAGDQPVTGDWDNDGMDTIGVYRNAQFLLRNSNTLGFADLVFALGIPGDMPIAGNWDGIP